MRHDLDDAVQEVFVECFRQGGVLEAAVDGRVPSFRAFLYGVVRNVARRFESRTAPAASRLPEIQDDEPSLAYQVDKGESEALSLSWLGPTDWTAAQLLAGVPRNPPRRLTPRERAREFLEGFLRDGPRTSRDIWSAALPLGLTERTLERVKQELSIRSVRVCPDGQRLSYWLLPGQELPASAKRFVADLDYWTVGPLPRPTPLDEI